MNESSLSRPDKPEVVVCADADEIAARAAERVTQAACDAVAARGRFTLVLSGGSTPEKLHRLLTAPPYRDRMPWEQTFFFLGDERFVPYDDPVSNWGMARRTLLDAIPTPPENLLPIPTTDYATPDEAARVYEERLRTFWNLSEGELPVFDLILLGLGDDGHTASLFPGRPALQVTDRLAVGTPPGILPPPVDRVTLTFPVLNAARAALFLVAGEKKAPALQAILAGTASVETHPAAGVKPVAGTLTFLVDRAARGE